MTKVPLSRFSPEWNVKEYSPRDALSFCLASRVAYRPTRSKIRETMKFQSCERFDIRRGHDIDTQGYIAIGDKHILAAFRGTEKSLPDWLTNFQAVKGSRPMEEDNGP